MTEPDKVKNLKDYFIHVRKRPGMYLGQNTISKLYDHLQGYMMSYWFNNIDNPIDKYFFDNFNEFVYDYYGVKTNDNWKGVILEQCFGNEQNALDKFFELHDLFIEGTRTTDTKKIVLNLFEKLVFRQDNIENKLGKDFMPVLTELNDLMKEHALSILKYDYDLILEVLEEKFKKIPELKIILSDLEKQHMN